MKASALYYVLATRLSTRPHELHQLRRSERKGTTCYNRPEIFWATTSNKQLNFVQHIRTMLKTTGRAAVVVHNVLFEGGARRLRFQEADSAIRRTPSCACRQACPYDHGVKANVIFFE